MRLILGGGCRFQALLRHSDATLECLELLLALAPPTPQGLFDQDPVIQASDRVLDKASKSFALYLSPVCAGTGVPSEPTVVIGHRPGRDLVPSRTPKQDGSLEFIAGRQRRQVTVPEPKHIQWHEGKAPQI